MNGARSVALGVVVVATAACNMVTGAEDIELGPEQTAGATTTSGTGGASNASGASTGAATTGGATTSATSGSGGSGTLVPADGVTITDIKLYQGIERPIMLGGAEASSAIPIVAGRDALVRVFYSATKTSKGVIRISLGNGDPIEAPLTIAGTSNPSSLGSTANVTIPGNRVVAGIGLRADLLASSDVASGNNTKAFWPPQGLSKPTVQSAGSTVKIVLVPIAYGADGSNRLPDTSQQQVDRYRDAIYRMYPVPSVTVSVKPAVTWKQAVDPGGNGWDDLLNAIADFRQQSGAADDEYYYGVFNAANSFATFCNAGCVAGLSLLAGANDPMARAGIGIGFTGEDSAGTAAHEIGHQHGRPHAPCGVSQSVDPMFPHADGSIGVWGYDLISKVLVAPDKPDFMSYCHPEWVSDFNFKQLFTRIKLVNNAAWVGDLHVPYERISISADGRAKWLAPTENSANPSGEEKTLEVDTDDGPRTLVGRFYPYSHVGGGVLLVPKTTANLRSVSFDWAGARLHLPR